MGNGQAKKARAALALQTQPIQAERDKEIAFMLSERKMSMSAVARELGVNVSTVSRAYHRYLTDTRAITQETINAYRLDTLTTLDDLIDGLVELFHKGDIERKVLEPLGKFLHQRSMLLGLYPAADKSAQPGNINIVFVQGDSKEPVERNVIEGHAAVHEDTVDRG